MVNHDCQLDGFRLITETPDLSVKEFLDGLVKVGWPTLNVSGPHHMGWGSWSESKGELS